MSKYRSSFLLILMIFTGVILGSLIGSFLGNSIPILAYGPEPFGIKGFQLDLGIIRLSLTLLIDINVASLLGLIFAVMIFKRL
ncbi:DUF4321 domain-containing protein [Serpentinicella sp. ANB-PHB4]|uniref:DUF4321 domain-containing protein n=1 Tax=Serpentinicella sp. ANB-PHB4 TaxID=3074076 RepID=UPI00286395CE|nr:DUF4321 domain-containing protein [Serpentinicella sp. ANB-PHB4]MDR5657884.1 DUF4321 domain-containing protein [Serpentinicella sp. ANB-PHB4]